MQLDQCKQWDALQGGKLRYLEVDKTHTIDLPPWFVIDHIKVKSAQVAVFRLSVVSNSPFELACTNVQM